MYDEYIDRVSEVVTGIVQQAGDRNNVLVDLGKVEALLPRSEQVDGERYEQGSRIKAVITEVRSGTKGPQVILSRRDPELIKTLFELEVPEIADGLVEIRGVAREPGYRSKIAVESHTQGVDPVGACVGPRGSRVRMVVSELRGEKIDIIPWNPEPARFVAKALSPARVREVVSRRRREGGDGRRPRRPARARDRQGGHERPPRRASHRLEDRHPERLGVRAGGSRRRLRRRRRRARTSPAAAPRSSRTASAARTPRCPARASAASPPTRRSRSRTSRTTRSRSSPRTSRSSRRSSRRPTRKASARRCRTLEVDEVDVRGACRRGRDARARRDRDRGGRGRGRPRHGPAAAGGRAAGGDPGRHSGGKGRIGIGVTTEPVRRCAGCGRQAPQRELVRFVARDGVLVARAPGSRARRLHVPPTRLLRARATAQRGFARTLRQPVRVDPALARLYTGGANG